MGKKKFVQNEYNTRISNICYVRSANMLYKGYVIGVVSEEKNDAGEFDWVIKMNWENWEKAGKPAVSGIDLDLRLDEYIRTFIPAFVTERTLPDNRVNLKEELAAKGMIWNDRFEFMCRNHGSCGKNDILVERLWEGVVNAKNYIR